jgi:hypothetical protein
MRMEPHWFLSCAEQVWGICWQQQCYDAPYQCAESNAELRNAGIPKTISCSSPMVTSRSQEIITRKIVFVWVETTRSRSRRKILRAILPGKATMATHKTDKSLVLGDDVGHCVSPLRLHFMYRTAKGRSNNALEYLFGVHRPFRPGAPALT